MLVPKKIEPKKLIVYILIMAGMLGGAGFFVYKIYFSSPHKSAPSEELTIEEIVKQSSDQMAPLENNIGAGEEVRRSINTGSGEEVFNTSFFSEMKFRILKDNSVINAPKSVPGNDNPFSPYE